MTESNIETKSDEHKRVIGKIIHIEMPSEENGQNKGGYGFITSTEIPLTRIFFHWTGMMHNTIPFVELKKDMKVEFTPSQYFDKNNIYQGYRALKIRVITE